MPLQIKICGIRSKETIDVCAACGVDYLGFNFVPASPRFITPSEAGALAAHVPTSIKKVAVTADFNDEQLGAILKDFPADYLQLHGSESPTRVAAIKQTFGKPVIKSFSVGEDADLEEVTIYESVADMFLFDARPPAGAAISGGNAVSFDWTLMRKAKVMRPWFLAGGLNEENISTALADSGAAYVDVASGVEKTRGVKDAALIRAFVSAART